MKKINVLVIGSSGLVGDGVIKYFCRNKINVIGVSQKRKNKLKSHYFKEYQNIDLNKKKTFKKIEKIIKLNKINIIINCSALIPNKIKSNKLNKNIERKMLNINAYSNLPLNSLCKKYKVKFYVYISTFRVKLLYKNFTKKNIKNNLNNLYIFSKIKAEKILNNIISKKPNHKIIILRITSPYGYIMNTNAIIPNVIKKIKNKNKININGNGSRKQFLTFVEDIAKFCLQKFHENSSSRTYNFFNPEAPNIKTIIKNINKIFFNKEKFLINYKKNGDNSNILVEKFKNKNNNNFIFTSLKSGLKTINSKGYQYE